MASLLFKEYGCVIKEIKSASIVPDNEDRIYIYEGNKKSFFRVDDRVFKYLDDKLLIDIHLTRISTED